MSWQLQKAKQRFSELIRRALEEGPQVVTRRGEEVAVVLSAKTYRELSGSQQDFAEFLLSGPDLAELEIRRSSEPTRAIEL